MVFATQNPIEQEGTYPLPEAQLDRFMFMIDVGYPSEAEECDIVATTTQDLQAAVRTVVERERILAYQALVRRIPAAQSVVAHAVALARATRPQPGGVREIAEYVNFGAGPRAGQFLVLGAKARAALRGDAAASVDDVRALAHEVLRHRVLVNFHAEANGVKAGDLVDIVLNAVKP
jgi:MoxR-like ATPase